jgi:hypothetical protein
VSIQALKKILFKDPIIHTYRPDEIVNKPEEVDEVYSLHAQTHMSIGETQTYLDRLIMCVSKNKKTFVGGVVGDYGEGKTSIMVYLFRKCEDAKIFAVPPYVWFSFQDHFRVIYSWAKYRLGKINRELILDLDRLYEKYRDPSLEKTAKEIALRSGGSYDEILAVVTEEYEKGVRVVEFTEEDLLSFCEGLSLLVGKIGYKGLVVFNDELELTIEAPGNSRDGTLNRLFKLADTLNNSVGNYGFFFGMPLSEYAVIRAGRRAISDRLEAQKVFIRLSEVYGSDFAYKLWRDYVRYFEIVNSNEIVDEETLLAIGQICDSARKDLGNGPRSVISAFNRMIFRYEHNHVPYTPIDFIDDCLRDEVQLTKGSQLAQKVKSVLAGSKVKGRYEKAVMLLAAFPNGCAKQIARKYDLDKEVEELIRETGLGRVVFEAGDGKALVVLQQGDIPIASYLEELLRSFYSHYSAGSQDIQRAVDAFSRIVIDSLFEKRQGQQIEGWDIHKPPKQIAPGVYTALFIGTFGWAAKYPFRTVKIIVMSENSRAIPQKVLDIPADFTFLFKLYFSERNRALNNSIETLSEDVDDFSVVGVKINLLDRHTPVKLGIPVIPDNDKTTVPLFALSLIGHLESQEIPKNEERECQAIKGRLLKNIKFAIFNDDMRENHQFHFRLDNKGDHLFHELFAELCKKRFLEYTTLITQPHWDKKVDAYANVLKRQDIPLVIKRGKEAWRPATDPSESKKIIAKAFNVSASNLISWLEGLDALVDKSELEKGKGSIRFKVHPLEEKIIEEIDGCAPERMLSISGKKCKWCDAADLLRKILPLGYLEQELISVIGGIGVARKFFDTKSHFIPEEGKTVQILYRMPFTPEEFRAELQEKVKSLQDEYSYLEAVQGFDKKTDLDGVIREIATLTEDEHYETLKLHLTSLFTINHKWICIKIEDIKSTLDLELGSTDRKLQDLKKQNTSAILNAKLEGQSRWIAKFRELIQENLKHQYTTILQNLGTAEKQVLTMKNKFTLDDKKLATEGARQLLEFQRSATGMKEKLNSIGTEVDYLGQHVHCYQSWLKLIRYSDEAFTEALKIKTSPAYKEESFLKEFELISQSIEDSIVKHNISLLKNHEAFAERIAEVEEKCKRYYYQYRDQFQADKKTLIDFLNNIAASTNQIRSAFDPHEPKKSYDELYESVCATVQGVLSELREDLALIGHETRYISEVLRVESDTTRVVAEEVEKAIAKHTALLGAVDIEKFKDAGAREAYLGRLKEEVVALRNSVGNMKKLYKEMLVPQALTDSERELLQCVKGNAEYNLKQIIVAFKEITDESGLNLDSMLELLGKLFKKNAIDIKIRRK